MRITKKAARSARRPGAIAQPGHNARRTGNTPPLSLARGGQSPAATALQAGQTGNVLQRRRRKHRVVRVHGLSLKKIPGAGAGPKNGKMCRAARSCGDGSTYRYFVYYLKSRSYFLFKLGGYACHLRNARSGSKGNCPEKNRPGRRLCKPPGPLSSTRRCRKFFSCLSSRCGAGFLHPPSRVARSRPGALR